MAPKKASTRKTKRDASVESAASERSNASKSSKSSKSSKHSDEGEQKSKASKKKTSTSSSSKKRGGRRTRFEQMDEEEELALIATTSAPSTKTPMPETAVVAEEATVQEVAPVAAAAAASSPAPEDDEAVPLAAVQAVDVDRTTEADHGLLKEPAPPAPGIRRVTVEDNPAEAPTGKMPPKRKATKPPRSQQRAAAVVNVDESDEQTLRETFDVASIPMNESGTDVSQQRQLELRSPSAAGSARKGRKAATKVVSPKAPKSTKRTRREEEEETVDAEDGSDRRAHGARNGGEGNRTDEEVALAQPAPDGHVGGGSSLAEATLESLVVTGAASTTADHLLNTYRRGEQVTALCAMLNLVAKASGVQDVELDGSALADGVDISPLLEELYARVPQDSAAYLLVNKDPKYRRFRRAFPEFAEKLMKLAWSGDVLLDGVLLPTLAQWVMTMSESKSRSFRHTATVMLLGFIEGLNALYADHKERLTLARTKKETTELEKHMDELARWRDHFFTQAIHQRLRDVAPEIRLGVFQALKGWVLDFRDEYMTNKYLRYFGMPLHDKKAELRAEALDMIWQALYTVPDAYQRMHLFLQYFINRLVEMSNDVDVRCAELAIRVVAMMVREDSNVAEGNELLKNTMIDRVLLNLFDERPTIRTAAGILLKVFIHCRTAGEETEEAQVRVATELLCSFASTLRTLYEEKMPEKYLIDALWTPERLPLLLVEYRPMLEVAQTADVSSETVVGLSLLTALLCKMQGKLMLGPLPKDDRKGSAAAVKRPPKSTQETVEDLRRSISEDLVTALCGILERHRGDQPVLRAVAHAIAALDLSAVVSGRPASHLENVMLELRKATLSAPCSEQTRDALVAAWHALAFTEHPLKGSAQAHLGFLLKQIVQQVSKVQEAGGAVAAGASPVSSLSVRSRGSQSAAAAAAKATEDALNAWGRFSLISSLVSTSEQWPVVQAALARQLDQANHADHRNDKMHSSSSAGSGSFGVGAVAGSQGSHDHGDDGGDDADDDELMAKTFELLEWEVETAVNGALWRVSAAAQCGSTDDGTAQDNQSSPTAAAEAAVRENIANVVAVLLQCLRVGDGVLRAGATTAQAATVAALVSLRCKAVVYLCDLAVLKYYDMPQVEQETLVDAFDSLFEYESAQLRVAQDVLRSAVSQRGENSILSQVAAARQQSSHVEALQMRLAVGVSRLLVLKRMDPALAPRVLVQWTQTSSKAVSDTFKSLFHTLRDRAGEAFHLERDTLLTAYGRCAEVGATPASVEVLYQTGTKLASMHFGGTDRYYPTVVAVVQFAAEFAASTDPLLLQGVVPYCNKLRPADALRLVRQEMATQDIFMNPTNPHARAFVAAMRKAAKLEEFLSSSSAAVSQVRTESVGVGAKRPREIHNGAQEHEQEDHMLAEIARSVTEGARRAAPGKSARMSVTTRVVTEDGWRELPSSQPVSVPLTPQEPSGNVQGGAVHEARSRAKEGNDGKGYNSVKRKSGARAAVDMPTSQEMAMSSLADGLNTEAFIATEEFE